MQMYKYFSLDNKIDISNIFGFATVGLPLFDTRVRRLPWTYRVRTWTAKIHIQLLKISYASSLGLSPTISAQFTFEMRVAAPDRKKLL